MWGLPRTAGTRPAAPFAARVRENRALYGEIEARVAACSEGELDALVLWTEVGEGCGTWVSNAPSLPSLPALLQHTTTTSRYWHGYNTI